MSSSDTEQGITEYSQDVVPKRRRRGLKIAAGSLGAVVLIVGGVWGGTAYASYSSTQADAAAQAAVPASETVAAPDNADPDVMAQSDVAGAQVIAAEQAKEAVAAAALAAQQAADAQAAKAKAKAAIGSGNAPAGTPIPLHLDTDPNSGSYGQMVIENPDQFCASNGGTTRSDGVAVCS